MSLYLYPRPLFSVQENADIIKEYSLRLFLARFFCSPERKEEKKGRGSYLHLHKNASFFTKTIHCLVIMLMQTSLKAIPVSAIWHQPLRVAETTKEKSEALNLKSPSWEVPLAAFFFLLSFIRDQVRQEPSAQYLQAGWRPSRSSFVEIWAEEWTGSQCVSRIKTCRICWAAAGGSSDMLAGGPMSG